MNKVFIMIIGAAAFGLAAPAAEARNQEMRALPGFEQLDTDQSGAITREQFLAGMQDMQGQMPDAMIARLMEHADEDGKLDEAALRAAFAAFAEERMSQPRRGQQRDARQDRAQMGERMFDRIDANNDGVIDTEEYEAFTSRMTQRMERHEHGGRWGRDAMRGKRGQD
ncbi:MAG: EF-hand domain-containing protein [Rhodobacteraceae bacterium]|nr:EF-hand domain-containing protein [Paracoccaceae bacterium]